MGLEGFQGALVICGFGDPVDDVVDVLNGILLVEKGYLGVGFGESGFGDGLFVKGFLFGVQ